MPVYFLAQVDIHDRAGYDRYQKMAGGSMAGVEAKVLAIDDQPGPLEGDWAGPRTVLIEFPDEAMFRKWYDSSAYKEAIKVRQAATHTNAVMLHGMG